MQAAEQREEEPHPPGTKLVPNGLPVFKVYYANDDDGERKLGSDSHLLMQMATDAGMSTFDAGVHTQMDVTDGLSLGQTVGQRAVARAQGDGAK